MTKRNSGNKKKIVAGAALATAAAAGAAYWLYGSKDAAEHRKMVGQWSGKAQKEIIAASKKLKKLDKKSYANLVNKVTKRYSSVKGITAKELVVLSRDLKRTWNDLSKSASPKKKAAKPAKKSRTKRVR